MDIMTILGLVVGYALMIGIVMEQAEAKRRLVLDRQRLHEQRDALLKAVDGLLDRFDVFLESDWCDEIDQETYDSARATVANVRGAK